MCINIDYLSSFGASLLLLNYVVCLRPACIVILCLIWIGMLIDGLFRFLVISGSIKRKVESRNWYFGRHIFSVFNYFEAFMH